MVEVDAIVAVCDKLAIGVPGTKVGRRGGHEGADVGGDEGGCEMHGHRGVE